MDTDKKLQQELDSVFSDWGDDFVVDIDVMKDKAETARLAAQIIRNVTYLTVDGETKTARQWWRPEVCTWDAFRSRIKRYRETPDRYTLTEVINDPDIGRAARTGTRKTRRRRPNGNLAKKPIGLTDPMMLRAVCGSWRE